MTMHQMLNLKQTKNSSSIENVEKKKIGMNGFVTKSKNSNNAKCETESDGCTIKYT